MSYRELIEKALKGRTAAQAARDWHIPGMTLHRYVTGERTPNVSTTLLLAKEAGVTVNYAAQAVAEQEETLKNRTITEKFSANFDYLMSLVRPRQLYVSAR